MVSDRTLTSHDNARNTPVYLLVFCALALCFGLMNTTIARAAGLLDTQGIAPVTVATVSGVPTDFAADVMVQYDTREMKTGDTALLYPRRIPQIVGNSVANDVFRPDFHLRIVQGNSVSLSTKSTNDRATVTAVKPGLTVVAVSYDSSSYNGKTYGASSPINTAYIVYDVNDDPSSVEPVINTPWRSYDTLYYAKGQTQPLDFSIDASGATTTRVTCNGKELTARADGTYRAQLENANNILGLETLDAAGKRRSVYKTIDARMITVNVTNATHAGEPLAVGDQAKVSFTGITNPVPKLAGIYNPTWYSPSWGSYGTYVQYDCAKDGKSYYGRANQWDLDTANSFKVSIEASGTYSFTFKELYTMWWGDALGGDKNRTTAPPNTAALTNEATFSAMPDFSFVVGTEDSGSGGEGGDGSVEPTSTPGGGGSVEPTTTPGGSTGDTGSTGDNNSGSTGATGSTQKKPATTAKKKTTKKTTVKVSTKTTRTGTSSVAGTSGDATTRALKAAGISVPTAATSQTRALMLAIYRNRAMLSSSIDQISQTDEAVIIRLARRAQALTPAQRALVTNYATLEKACTTLGTRNHTLSMPSLKIADLPWYVRVNATPLGATQTSLEQLESLKSRMSKATILGAWDITLVDTLTGATYQPASSVGLSLETSAGASGSSDSQLGLIHLHGGVTDQLSSSVDESGTLTARTESFSTFALVRYTGTSPFGPDEAYASLNASEAAAAKKGKIVGEPSFWQRAAMPLIGLGILVIGVVITLKKLSRNLPADEQREQEKQE